MRASFWALGAAFGGVVLGLTGGWLWLSSPEAHRQNGAWCTARQTMYPHVHLLGRIIWEA